MEMTGGYPEEANIETYLAALGIEIVDENNNNFMPQYKQFVYGLINAVRWAASLGVWLPSATTFNVRDGRYNWRGTVKTYTAGSAVDPTDNDTTYVWMSPDNTIGSGIDGDGWPESDHIKLAEITVDSDGVITDVTDMRGEPLPPRGVRLLASVDAVDLNSVAFNSLYQCAAGKKWIPVAVVMRNLSGDAASTLATLGESASQTDFLGTQTLSNIDAAGKAAILQPIPNATPVAIVEYDENDAFGVDITQAAGSACTATFDVFGDERDA